MFVIETVEDVIKMTSEDTDIVIVDGATVNPIFEGCGRCVPKWLCLYHIEDMHIYGNMVEMFVRADEYGYNVACELVNLEKKYGSIVIMYEPDLPVLKDFIFKVYSLDPHTEERYSDELLAIIYDQGPIHCRGTRLSADENSLMLIV